jgi:hypothetical protein
MFVFPFFALVPTCALGVFEMGEATLSARGIFRGKIKISEKLF